MDLDIIAGLYYTHSCVKMYLHSSNAKRISASSCFFTLCTHNELRLIKGNTKFHTYFGIRLIITVFYIKKGAIII